MISTLLVATAFAASQSLAGLVGQWEFEDSGDLGVATIGTDLGLTGAITSTAGSGGLDAGAANVGVNEFLTVTSPIGANGGGLRSNEYTLLIDFKIPTLTGWIALFEMNSPAGGDGDYFYSSSRGLGLASEGYVGDTPPSSVPEDTWVRLILAVNQGTARSTYVDGILIGDHNTGTVDGHWTLGSTLDLFSDNGGGEEAISHVSNVALFDTVLSSVEITALGTAGSVIPEPGTLGMVALFGGGILFIRRKRLL